MKPQRLLCLGDSLTEGYDIEPEKVWVSRLRDDHGWEVTNAGISGDTTAGMLARLPLILSQGEYSHAIVMGGTNDIEFGLLPNEIIVNIKAIMRQLRYHGIPYVIGIPTPLNDAALPGETFFYVPDAATYRADMEDYGEQLRAFLEMDEADTLDFDRAFRTEDGTILSELLLSDGVHPSDEGHQLIVRMVLDYFGK